MSRRRLRDDLKKIVVPGEDDARKRAWELAVAAQRERDAATDRGWVHKRVRRLLVASAAALCALAFALTPAGADVREWLGEVIDSGESTRELALKRLPAPGKLLVRAESGLWTVEQDGSRRSIGDYETGSWSPHGMYIAAARGRRLTAIDPRGEVRWAITRGPISDPRWSPGSGYRIAYRSGSELRVVWGDGTNDRGFGPAAAIAPAWRPSSKDANVLAYVDRAHRVRVLDVDQNEARAITEPLDRLVEIVWSRDGGEILALSADAVRIIEPDGAISWTHRFQQGQRAVAADFGPAEGEVTVVLHSTHGEPRSSVMEIETRRSGAPGVRQIFAGSGSLEGLSFSPDGARYVTGWPDADQWLFFPAGKSSRIRTIGNVANQFEGRSFPRVEGWCCGE